MLGIRVENAKYCVESLDLYPQDSHRENCRRERMKLCGYCEYGYRLFMTDRGSVVKLPIPYVFTEYHGRYWW